MKFLAFVTLKSQPGPEVLPLIASELTHCQKLKNKGVIDNTWFEIDDLGTPTGKTSWFLINAANRQAAQDVLSSFPMYKYLDLDIEIRRVGVRWDED